MKLYIKNLFIAVDQLLNTLKGGYPDETLSSAAYRSYRDGKGSITYIIYNNMFFWERDSKGNLNHCEDSYISELKNKHLPPEFRELDITKYSPFSFRDNVKHLTDSSLGIGTIIMIQSTGLTPIIVQWGNGEYKDYTLDGKHPDNLLAPSIIKHNK